MNSVDLVDKMSYAEMVHLREALDKRFRAFDGRKILAFYSPYPSSGKTTAAKWLTHTWRYFGRVVSFSEPLKDMVKSLYLYHDGQSLFDYNKIKNEPMLEFDGDTPRDIMCLLGKTLRDHYGQRIFADLASMCILNSAAENVVIDDLRLPEEYDMLAGFGAKFVRIVVPDRKIITTDTEGRLEDHHFDAKIVNEMINIHDFYQDLVKVVTQLWPQD